MQIDPLALDSVDYLQHLLEAVAYHQIGLLSYYPRDTWLTILNDTKHLREEYDKRVERVEKIRAGALERFHVFNDEYPRLANTPWAMWQAVVETEDYRRGHADSATALFGQRANTKARAFKTALECCR